MRPTHSPSGRAGSRLSCRSAACVSRKSGRCHPGFPRAGSFAGTDRTRDMSCLNRSAACSSTPIPEKRTARRECIRPGHYWSNAVLVAQTPLLVPLGAAARAAVDRAGVLATGPIRPDLDAVRQVDADNDHRDREEHLDRIGQHAVVGEVVDPEIADAANEITHNPASPYLTISLPTMPASAWPGIAQWYSYSPGGKLTLTSALAPPATSPVSATSLIVKVCGKTPLFTAWIVTSVLAGIVISAGWKTSASSMSTSTGPDGAAARPPPAAAGVAAPPAAGVAAPPPPSLTISLPTIPAS